MLIENEFQVPATIDRAWAYLLDVEAIAPCAPGAELTEVVDDDTWKGRINLKLGPIALSFAGTVTVAERDEANHRVVLKAQGQEQKGKGAANATVTSWLGFFIRCSMPRQPLMSSGLAFRCSFSTISSSRRLSTRLAGTS